MTSEDKTRWRPGKVISEVFAAPPAGPAAPTRGRPRTRPVADERRSILDAALAVFAEHGFAGCTIEEVARRAEVQRRAVYDQFGGKNVLFAAVVEDALTRTFERMATALGEIAATDVTVDEAFRRNIRFALSLAADDPGLAFIVHLSLATGDDEAARVAQDGRRRFEDALALSLRTRWNELALPGDGAAPMIAAMIVTLAASMSVRLTQEPGWSVDDLTTLLSELILGGVTQIEHRRLTDLPAIPPGPERT